MEFVIKQLKQGSLFIVPQTTAEAVLVKNNLTITSLDLVLKQKSNIIITSENSGITLTEQDNSVIITHSNLVNAINTITPLLISYDNRGHITNSQEVKPFKVIVNNNEYLSHNGLDENNLKLGDDFKIDENDNIKLNWNEYGTT